MLDQEDSDSPWGMALLVIGVFIALILISSLMGAGNVVPAIAVKQGAKAQEALDKATASQTADRLQGAKKSTEQLAVK